MKATIEINGLRLRAYHGAVPQENIAGNIFEIDVVLEADIKPSAYVDDQIDGTINYASVIAIIKQEMSIRSSLLEHVAYRIKNAISGISPDIIHGSIKIAKVLPPIANVELQSVAVAINW